MGRVGKGLLQIFDIGSKRILFIGIVIQKINIIVILGCDQSVIIHQIDIIVFIFYFNIIVGKPLKQIIKICICHCQMLHGIHNILLIEDIILFVFVQEFLLDIFQCLVFLQNSFFLGVLHILTSFPRCAIPHAL